MSFVTIYILITTILFGLSISLWFFNAFIIPIFMSDNQDIKWDKSDVQLRVLTVDNSKVVKDTVESANKIFTDVKVISERKLENISCDVDVVPNDFESEAIRKGRALEWARKNIEYDGEYVLYIDEDTIIKEFKGLPDADVIQFREHPTLTDSLLSYLTEIHRMGYQYEQRSFNFYRYPLYAWGGGIAIRQSLEDQVTWNRRSITEDTSFVWKAAEIKDDLSFAVTGENNFENQSPTSIKNLLKQRRRWVSGTIMDMNILSPLYRLFVSARIFTWVYSPVILINGLIVYTYPDPIFQATWLIVLLIIEILLVHLMTLVGVLQYCCRDGLNRLIFIIPLTLILSTINSVGALWGIVQPATDFKVTEKS